MDTSELKHLAELIADLEIEKSVEYAKSLLGAGKSSEEIGEMVLEGLNEVGRRYAAEQYFLADLVVSGIIAKNIYALSDKSTAIKRELTGTVIFGTIKDDIHDIGKDIMVNTLRSKGVSVIDLGVDVPVSEFVFAAKKYRSDIVGVSCVMAGSIGHLQELGECLRNNGLLENCRYIIGGAAADGYLDIADADLITNDLYDGVNYCIETLKKKMGGF